MERKKPFTIMATMIFLHRCRFLNTKQTAICTDSNTKETHTSLADKSGPCDFMPSASLNINLDTSFAY